MNSLSSTWRDQHPLSNQDAALRITTKIRAILATKARILMSLAKCKIRGRRRFSWHSVFQISKHLILTATWHIICRQKDFLPFKCDCCHKVFCLEHRTYETHSCEKADKSSPATLVCPLCARLVKIENGENANVSFDRHTKEVTPTIILLFWNFLWYVRFSKHSGWSVQGPFAFVHTQQATMSVWFSVSLN